MILSADRHEKTAFFEQGLQVIPHVQLQLNKSDTRYRIQTYLALPSTVRQSPDDDVIDLLDLI